MPRTRQQRRRLIALTAFALAGLLVALWGPRLSGQTTGTGWKVIAWNNLGMHCMDADFGVFAILPPYNTIQAQVVNPSGDLITSPGGLSVTYEAIADPSKSINTTSAGKTNFWTFLPALFGVSRPVDAGLLGNRMPGSANTAQPMTFDAGLRWFIAEGIPITPYDDQGAKNYYPLMKVTAADAATGAPLASTTIVLPVSDEMDCRACHASGSGAAARPSAGWVYDANAQRDYRLNILRLHDDRQLGTAAYGSALQAAGYAAAGLAATQAGGMPILCAKCHASEALPGTGVTGVHPLTAAIHTRHATVVDPTNGLALDATANRSACYRCHPGSETKCLRGAMGNAVAADGSLAIQCQNCHGSMGAVGSSSRTGWFNEPTCQNCHTGTATSNSGAIRFTSVFDNSGLPRVAANATFATQNDTPQAGLNLYRFSAGHGGLQCSACHGSTHAEFPSSHPNDNLQSVALQGHVGTIGECSTCHGTAPTTVNGGPHGMHPVGSSWVSRHGNAAEGNRTQCQACHGTDYRGTVLSRTFGARSFTTGFGTKAFFRGAQVSCYACHNGPSSESASPNRAPVVKNVTASANGAPVAITLPASDADGNALTLRIVSQPANGTAGVSGTVATYRPDGGFSGTDTFTYAAWDGSIDSNLGTVTVTVVRPSCTVSASASGPITGAVGAALTFSGNATTANCLGPVSYDWSFGDGTAHSPFQNPVHAYAAGGSFTWTMTATQEGVSSSASGSLTIGGTVVAPAPTITRVTQLSNPFRIQIDGSGFQSGVAVYLGSGTTPWAGTTRVSSQRLVLSGSGLSNRFPRRTSVTIRVANPDGQSATTTFRRQ
jgi:PKD repeat protein